MKTLNIIFIAVVLLTTLVNFLVNYKKFKKDLKELKRKFDVVEKKQYFSKATKRADEEELKIQQGKLGLRKVGMYFEVLIYVAITVLYICK